MSVLPSGIQTLYENASKLFIEELGKSMSLYYEPTLSQTTDNPVAPYGMNNFNELGEPIPLDSLQGRSDQSGQNLKETSVSETIKVRAYWETSVNVLASLGVSMQTKVVRINAYLSDTQKLLQCNYAEINSPSDALIKLRVTMLRGPIPYGLGHGYSYTISYWKAT